MKIYKGNTYRKLIKKQLKDITIDEVSKTEENRVND